MMISGIVSLKNHFQKNTELSLYWKTREKIKTLLFIRYFFFLSLDPPLMKVTTNSTLITSGGQTVYLHCQVENLGDRQVNPFPRCCKWTSYKIQNSTNVSTVFSRKQAFYEYIYFVVTVKITNSKLVDRSTILSCGKCDNNKTDIESGKWTSHYQKTYSKVLLVTSSKLKIYRIMYLIMSNSEVIVNEQSCHT